VLRDHRGQVLLGVGIVALTAGFNGILFAHMPAYLVEARRERHDADAEQHLAAVIAQHLSDRAAGGPVPRSPVGEVLRDHRGQVLLGVGIVALTAGFNGILFAHMDQVGRHVGEQDAVEARRERHDADAEQHLAAVIALTAARCCSASASWRSRRASTASCSPTCRPT
jgi:hypothetical protein